MDERFFEEVISRAVATGDWSNLEEWITKESSFSFNYGSSPDDAPFSDQVFDLILGLLKQQEFLEAEGSFNVLRILEYDYSTLSDHQKEELLPALEAAYSKFRSSTSWFIISELLGEYFGNDAALQTLCRLRSISDEDSRSLLPMGLLHIAKKCNDPDLSERACVTLMQMRDDTSEQVLSEVEAAVQALELSRKTETQ